MSSGPAAARMALYTRPCTPGVPAGVSSSILHTWVLWASMRYWCTEPSIQGVARGTSHASSHCSAS
eukprot:4909428-Lingulodinium_polyedra.AAC.1